MGLCMRERERDFKLPIIYLITHYEPKFLAKQKSPNRLNDYVL